MTDSPDDYDDQWNQLTEKTLLVQCVTELQQIRMLLQSQTQEPQTPDEQTYLCVKCDAEVTKDDREQHATGQHNAPSDMVKSLFVMK